MCARPKEADKTASDFRSQSSNRFRLKQQRSPRGYPTNNNKYRRVDRYAHEA